MKGGIPLNVDSENWEIVRTGKVAVYVPKDKNYKGDILRIVHFRKDDNDWVGVANEL